MTTKTTPATLRVVYTGERAITVPVPDTGHNEIFVWGDEFSVDHTFAHYDVLTDEKAQLERFGGKILFLLADDPNAAEVLLLRSEQDEKERDAALEAQRRNATTHKERARISIQQQEQAVAAARAAMDATTAGSVN